MGSVLAWAPNSSTFSILGSFWNWSSSGVSTCEMSRCLSSLEGTTVNGSWIAMVGGVSRWCLASRVSQARGDGEKEREREMLGVQDEEAKPMSIDEICRDIRFYNLTMAVGACLEELRSVSGPASPSRASDLIVLFRGVFAGKRGRTQYQSVWGSGPETRRTAKQLGEGRRWLVCHQCGDAPRWCWRHSTNTEGGWVRLFGSEKPC